ncbi:unnamed protein product [Cyprideis torosa]|uniref:glutamate racemase n=1 Tax=Cyprideis torosa TaxID=163714 RepID=A0A7R8ZUD7_9CRUS|nr:unnamed protein product [Cyprideis torosa]CAG0909455.1 unnamed protein product [Cyprideis torosa]
MNSSQQTDAAPIGVFDSGVGGLSVLRQIRQQLPHESFVYVADSRFAPYGQRSDAFIQQRSLTLTRFLVDQGAKLVVVACNTATAAAVQLLRDTFSIPIVAMEPAVKPAVQLTRSGRIGVLATTGTLASARFAALLDRFGSGVEVHTRPCEGWVECVEQGHWQDASAIDLVRRQVAPLLEKNVDTLILGCTHYPFLAPLIRQVAGDNVAIVDTGEAVARRVAQVLQINGLQIDASSAPREQFYSSRLDQSMIATTNALWGSPIRELTQLPDLHSNSETMA